MTADTRSIGGTLMEPRDVTRRVHRVEAIKDISFDIREAESRAATPLNGARHTADHNPLARAASPGRARPSPREGAWRPLRIERRRKAWRHRAPTVAVAPAPSQARARPSAPGAETLRRAAPKARPPRPGSRA